MSSAMKEPAFCICENKGADQLHGCENKGADQLHANSAADLRLCFRYIGSAIHILLKSETSSLQPSSVVVQPYSCLTWSRFILSKSTYM